MNPIILIILGAIVILGLSRDSGGGSLIDQAAALIAGFESFSAVPYWDVSQWSIGYGTGIGTDRNHKPNVTWTREQAYNALKDRVQRDYGILKGKVVKQLTTNQWVALLSFAYNLGVGGSSQIIFRINQGLSATDIADAMKLYVYSEGSVSPGLVDRRQKESTLFVS